MGFATKGGCAGDSRACRRGNPKSEDRDLTGTRRKQDERDHGITPGGEGTRQAVLRQLYVQVLVAIALGALIGHFWPETASLKPLGDAFIKLVKMIIAPVIFLTVVDRHRRHARPAKVGGVAGKAFAYFITVSTLALVVGLIVANVVQPGAGMNIDPATPRCRRGEGLRGQVARPIVGFLMDIIPTTVVGAFVDGNILQVLFFSILFGLALAMVGERGEPVLERPARAGRGVLQAGGDLDARRADRRVRRLRLHHRQVRHRRDRSAWRCWSPPSTSPRSCSCWWCWARSPLNGFSILKLIRYLKEELLLVLGTSSSEAALPSLMEKMERAGAQASVVGLVVPTGYSFNLDGTNIYMTLAALFIAQALGIELSLGEQICCCWWRC